MHYFRAENGDVYAYDDDQIKMGYPLKPMVPMTKEEIFNHLNPQPTPEDLLAAAIQQECDWRIGELSVIARQLEAIEEDEADETPPDLLPGTRKQWLKYRGQVSNWKDGAESFPDIAHRPIRPT